MKEPEKTIVIIESHGKKHSSELNWDAGIYDILNAFYGLCVAATFDPVTVVKCIREWSEEKCENFEYLFNNSDK
jgi:hypothetical protein